MATIYLTHWVRWTGHSKGVIAATSRFSSISRGHLRAPVKHPMHTGQSTGFALHEPIHALADNNWVVVDGILSSKYTSQMGQPNSSKRAFGTTPFHHRAERTARLSGHQRSDPSKSDQSRL